MTTSFQGKMEVSKEASEMLESMPQEIAISVMISLAVNMVRLSKGELKGEAIPDDPIMLIAEISAMIVLQSTRRKMKEKSSPETVDKTKVH